MQGREFLALAKENIAGNTERHWRGAAGRAYYALMLECREALFRWGFLLPPRENVHTYARLRFSFPADVDLKKIGKALEDLCKLRNWADYNLAAGSYFASSNQARQAIQKATDAISLLDTIDGDPGRLAVAIAAIRVRFP
jgi:hypothetical protein